MKRTWLNIQRLHNWSQQKRIPLEYIYSDTQRHNGGDPEKRWHGTLQIQNQEHVLADAYGPSKIAAGEALAIQFFDKKLDEEIPKHVEPLAANSLHEFCDRFAVSDFVVSYDGVASEKLALARTSYVAGLVQDAKDKGDKERASETYVRLLDKSFRKTLEQHKGLWRECTIWHRLWPTGRFFTGVGRTEFEAFRAAQARALSQCLKDADLFGKLVMPDSACNTPIANLFGGQEHGVTIEYFSAAWLTNRESHAVVNTLIADQFEKQRFLGVDCEFVHTVDAKTQTHETRLATVQVASGTTVAVFQVAGLTRAQWPTALVFLLAGEKPTKFTVNVTSDAAVLRQAGIELKGAIDVQRMASRYPEFNATPSLAIMTARLCRLQLPKHDDVRLSDWAASPLTMPQVEYAARDALASLMVGMALTQRAQAAVSDTAIHFSPNRPQPKDKQQKEKKSE